MFPLVSKRRYENVKAQRDRLNTENAVLAKQLAEADAQLQKSVEEIHGLRMQRTALQLKLDEATKPREDVPALEVEYYVKPGASAQLSDAEKPKPRTRRKGQAVNVGEDGTR